MDLRDYLRMVRRGWPTLVALVAVALLLGLAYLRVTPPVYESTAVILAGPRNAQNIGDLQTGAQYATSTAPTIATLMQSGAVLDDAAADVATAAASSSGRAISAADLGAQISVSAEEATSVITLVASSDDPDQAAELANAVAQSAVDVVPGLVSSDPRASDAPLLSLQVIQQGVVPGAPVSPDQGRVLTLTAVVGLALGLALTLTRQSLDSRILRAEDLRLVTGVKLLAVLPRRRRTKKTSVVVRDSPSSPAVEAYRVLRTNLGEPVGEARRSLLFTPAAADVVAPRVPVNVAWSMAQAGRRVLLVDLDLRRSVVADLLGLSNDVGAVDVLSGERELCDIVRHTAQQRLDVVTSGSTSLAPSDLLSGPALSDLVRKAELGHDVVILNLPPLLSYSDAAVVARVATETVIVVRAEETKAPELLAALEVLSNVGVSPLGLVLTGSKNSVIELARLARPAGRQPAPAGRRVAGVSRPVAEPTS